MWRRFRQPRRLVLSAVACVLALVWLGNAAITVWLREAASPDTLRALLSLGLVVYALWHLVKAAFFRPESPFDWTPAERDLLAPMPILPRDLVAYQLASVTVTTILKAGLFTVLLLPDLRCLPLGFIGVLLAMLALEVLRMTVDIATWGMRRMAYLAYRAVVVTGLVVGGFAVGEVIVRGNVFARINVGDGVLERLLDILVQLNASVSGYVSLPFKPFIELIVANSVTAANLGLAAGALAMVMGFSVAVVGLYAVTTRRVATRERRRYKAGKDGAESFVVRGLLSDRQTGMSAPRLLCVPHWGGAGALAWRQLVGAVVTGVAC